MEAPPQGGNVNVNDQENGGSSNGKSSSSFLCRQSSTRWTPTTEQIRILKDLYYNNGIRSPTAEQIQKISAKLRQYGKIEGKNVFYWFQNHKARERQKRRFTSTPENINTNTNTNNNIPMQRGVWRSSSDDHHHHHHPIYNKYPNLTSAGVTSPSTSSPGMLAVGHMGSYGYGSVAMENSFRNCSISTCGNGENYGSMGQNFSWVGMDHQSPYTYPFLDKRRGGDETLDEYQVEEDHHDAPEIETLPLFPMHGEDISGGFCNIKRESAEGCYMADWFLPENNNMGGGGGGGGGGRRRGGGGGRASLELTLNSYCGRSNQAP